MDHPSVREEAGGMEADSLVAAVLAAHAERPSRSTADTE
jgi:hypothetical protein